jgi:mRNA interferase RelE/StbE
MAWQIEFLREAEKDLEKLDFQVGKRIVKFLYDKVACLDDPRTLGEPLRGPELGRYWRYRVGDYRIVTSIQDEILTVLVVRVGHRRLVYR